MSRSQSQLGAGRRLHEREAIVRDAERTLRAAVSVVLEAGLTDGEYVRVIGGVLGDALASWAKFAIRVERHGDTDKPGGIA